ncbi:hypothetical protein ACPW7J_01815 [Ihubacter sp. rT4E-8]
MNNITLRKIRIGVVLIIVSLTLSITCSNGYAVTFLQSARKKYGAL